jgi:hypothetical protein
MAMMAHSPARAEQASPPVARATPVVQAKLRIGPVDDPLEREADQVADDVMRMPDPMVLPLRGGAPGETIRRKAVFRPDSGCGDYPMCEIVAAWDLAVGLIDDAIVVLNDVISKGTASSHHAKVMARFPAATAAELASAKTTLTSIKAELASDIVAKCVRAGEPCVGNVLAGTTCSAKADIDFCILFNMNDCRNQAAAIIHEIAHHIVCMISPAIDVTTKRKREVEREGKTETVEEEVKEKTGDVYRHFPEFKTLTATQALQNPDSFAVLCLDVSKRSTCFECAYIMQTDAKKWEAMKKRLKSEHSAPAAEDVKRKCAACEQEEVHRSPSAGAAGGLADAATQRALKSLSSGAPMSAAERTYFEPRFGTDFGGVRIHSGLDADRAAAAVGARAFTFGSDIAFADGEYRPGSDAGRALLAHELAHVVQQGGKPLAFSRKCAECAAEEETLRRKPLDANSPFAPLFGVDPLHAPLIADYRHRLGLPPGGVDEFGNRIGPSDAEIKYLLGPGSWLPPCPDVEEASKVSDFRIPAHKQAFLDTNCISPASQAMPPACAFSPDQERMLANAQSEAARRVRRAHDRITLTGKEGENFAQSLAKRVFRGEPPTIPEAVGWLTGVSNFLSGARIDFAGRTCGDPACQQFATKAYVKGPGQLPVFLCPLSFSYPNELSRTVLHEALHWAGLDADPTTPEGYCEKFDCQSPCQDKGTADAWAHYLDCLGQPQETRRSFIDKMVESVEEIP